MQPDHSSPSNSVSQWLADLKTGNNTAATPLWERYYPRLVAVARQRLAGFPRGVADEEDVALSAFNGFCRDVAAGRFPKLDDRNDLWQVFLMITGQKAIDLIRRESAEKRGGRPTRQTAEIAEVAGNEPSAEYAIMVAEEFARLLAKLEDSDLRDLAAWKIEGMSNGEIAARWGCAPRTVERRLKVIRSLWIDGEHQ